MKKSSGYACDYVSNELPDGWKRIKGEKPQKGDILVYDATAESPNGHVAIYESDYSTYHQNYAGQYYVVHVTNFAYDDPAMNAHYWGVIRPDWKTKEIQEGIYRLVTAVDNGKSLDIENGSIESCANAQIYSTNNTGAQIFMFKKAGSGYYFIQNLQSGKYLDVEGAGTITGTNLWQYNFNGTDAQRFRLVEAGGGYFFLVSKCNGLCVDVCNGWTGDGTNVWLVTPNGSDAQKWKAVSEKINITVKAKNKKKKIEVDTKPIKNLSLRITCDNPVFSSETKMLHISMKNKTKIKIATKKPLKKGMVVTVEVLLDDIVVESRTVEVNK